MEDKSGIEKERGVKRVPHADVENRCGTGYGSVLKNEFKLNDACTEHLAPETFAENYMRCAYTSCLTRLDAHLRVCSPRFFPPSSSAHSSCRPRPSRQSNEEESECQDSRLYLILGWYSQRDEFSLRALVNIPAPNGCSRVIKSNGN